MSAPAHPAAEHAHHHSDGVPAQDGARRTSTVVIITLVMMVAELVVGWWSGSMALTADGWHMGTHAGALGLSVAAYWYARSRADDRRFVFGTGKVYALAAYTSALLLLGVAVWMAVESVARLRTGVAVAFSEALPVAVIGLLVNGVSVWLLGGHGHGHDHDHDHGHGHDDHGHDGHAHDATDLNLKAAYLHVLADAATSVLAIAALLLGRYAGWWFLDPIMGLVGSALISWWAIGLVRSAAFKLLDAATAAPTERRVRAALEALDGVTLADLHVWELGPGKVACVVSLVAAAPREVEHYRQVIRRAATVAHLTVEVHACPRIHVIDASGARHRHGGHAHDHDDDHDHDHDHTHAN